MSIWTGEGVIIVSNIQYKSVCFSYCFFVDVRMIIGAYSWLKFMKNNPMHQRWFGHLFETAAFVYF